MPTYEYACRSCGHRLEVVQSFSDAPLTECPSCAGDLRKVLHAPGIAFKGSGFYKTDSRPSSSGASKAAPAASSDAAPSAGGSGGSGGSSDGGSAPAPATPAAAPAAAS